MKKPKPVRRCNFPFKFLIFFTLTLISFSTYATVLTEDFISLDKKESSTAVWNTELGVVHPTLQINYQVNSGDATTPAPVDVGDGSHGAFELSTYANFGSVVANTITIDALVFPILKLTRFQLNAGYTLTSINGPLIIYSLTTVIIDGTILCSGANGASPVGTTGGAGGVGRCGGYNGGNGGNQGFNGIRGFNPPDLDSGSGFGGATGATGGGGGGASSYSGSSGVAGAAGAGAGGAGGTAAANHSFTILNGSPGGGGGGGSATQGGAGGGAGGGTVIIRAVGDVTLSTTGVINALAGNGGAAGSGGGGGVGGGGSISVFTAGTLHLLNTTSVIQINVNAGTLGTSATGGAGGSGSNGRTWNMARIFNIDAGSGAESVSSGLNNPGDSPLLVGTTIPVRYITTPVTVISKSFDTKNTNPNFNSITSDPVSPNIALQVSGSNDNFIFDDTGWLDTSLITTIKSKRYLKFKLILTNTNDAIPTQVNSVSIDFEPGLKENFQFKSGCGLISKVPPTSGPTHIIMLTLLLLLPALIALKLRLKTFRTD